MVFCSIDTLLLLDVLDITMSLAGKAGTPGCAARLKTSEALLEALAQGNSCIKVPVLFKETTYIHMPAVDV